MNDTVATEDQEQPAKSMSEKLASHDRDPGRRTSSGPADICSASDKAGHMTAADQIVQSAKKVLAMEGRPHMGRFGSRDQIHTRMNNTPAAVSVSKV